MKEKALNSNRLFKICHGSFCATGMYVTQNKVSFFLERGWYLSSNPLITLRGAIKGIFFNSYKMCLISSSVEQSHSTKIYTSLINSTNF